MLEANSGDLLVYWLDTDFKSDELQDYLTTANNIVRVLETASD